MEESKKIRGRDLEDMRSVTFNIDIAYAASGGTLNGR
jgi:hypothetical protein